MRPARGFSLTALVVVLVIVGILAALTLPRLLDSETQASWYVEQVRAAVRYAQRQAVAQRRPVFVEVQASQVRLCYDAACASVLAQFADGQPYVLAAPTGVTIVAVPTFSFDGLGRPPAAQTISVGGQIITVQAETGYVQ